MPSPEPERGDIIVAEVKKTFPTERMQEVRMVVERVDADSVYCGIDGDVPRDHIVRVVGKSPDYDAATDEFHTTVVD